jgi:hypothetical protein
MAVAHGGRLSPLCSPAFLSRALGLWRALRCSYVTRTLLGLYTSICFKIELAMHGGKNYSEV